MLSYFCLRSNYMGYNETHTTKGNSMNKSTKKTIKRNAKNAAENTKNAAATVAMTVAFVPTAIYQIYRSN